VKVTTSDSDSDPVAAGREAWQRIRENSRRSFDDWVTVARALQIGRDVALREANTDRPFGSYYTAAIGRWLRRNGFYGLDGDRVERARAHRMLANLPAILVWRDGLDDEQRRRINHPHTVYMCWRRSITIAETAKSPVVAKASQRSDLGSKAATPTPSVTAPAATGYSKIKSVYWSQDHMRRAHRAMVLSRSSDLLTLARVALQAAIRNEADLLALLSADAPPAKKPRQIAAPAALELQ
jgi:hypothetical protein